MHSKDIRQVIQTQYHCIRNCWPGFTAKHSAKQKRIQSQKHKSTKSVNTIPHVENYSITDMDRPGQNVTQEMSLCNLCLSGHIPGETKEYREEHQSDLLMCCINSNLNYPDCVRETLPSESNCSDVDYT